MSTGPVVTPEGGYDLAPAGEGTQLTFYNVLEPANFMGKLIVGFALRSARKGADDFADSIKQTVESEVPGRLARAGQLAHDGVELGAAQRLAGQRMGALGAQAVDDDRQVALPFRARPGHA